MSAVDSVAERTSRLGLRARETEISARASAPKRSPRRRSESQARARIWPQPGENLGAAAREPGRETSEQLAAAGEDLAARPPGAWPPPDENPTARRAKTSATATPKPGRETSNNPATATRETGRETGEELAVPRETPAARQARTWTPPSENRPRDRWGPGHGTGEDLAAAGRGSGRSRGEGLARAEVLVGADGPGRCRDRDVCGSGGVTGVLRVRAAGLRAGVFDLRGGLRTGRVGTPGRCSAVREEAAAGARPGGGKKIVGVGQR
jgi:hypothetical protein